MDWEQFTMIDLESLATPEILERGIDYYRNGHLITAGRVDGVLAGVIAGAGGDYQARLWIEAGVIQASCSCPYSGFCKHLAALAFGWLEDRAKFINLRPLLDTALQNTAGLPALFTRLVYRSPLDFMQLMDIKNGASKQRPARATINLVRGIFKSAPFHRFGRIEALRDKLARVEKLLDTELAAGNTGALELLTEMLQGIAAIYKENHLPELTAYFRDLINLSAGQAGRFSDEESAGLYRSIFQCYFDPDLWELKEELKKALMDFQAGKPQFSAQYLKEAFMAENISGGPGPADADLFRLIGFYELLAPEPVFSSDPELNDVLESVSRKLESTSEGRLWLVDRLMASSPDKSYQLAKSALVSGMEPKSSFRDRLITVHQRRGELRQAASLSFIQFQEEPNFEEYLRLKEILRNHPPDWRSYLQRLQVFLQNGGNETLLLRIAIDLGDREGVAGRFAGAGQNSELLLAAAEVLLENDSPEMAAVYPQAVRLLLDEKTFAAWNAALRVIAAYKKICRQTGRSLEWESFRTRLMQEYPDDARFRRKFGAILGS